MADRVTVVQAHVLDRLADTVRAMVREWHGANPLLPGLRRDEMRARLGIGAQRAFDDVVSELTRRGIVRADGAVIADPDFAISLSSDDRICADAFIEAARREPFAPPPPSDHGLAPELVGALVALGELVVVSDQIAYPVDVFERIRDGVLAKLDRDATIALAEYRDLFETSRKYAQPTLEYLDEIRITRRKGDVRVRYRGAGAGA